MFRTTLFGTFAMAVLVAPTMPPTATAQRLRVVTTRVEIRLADDAIVRWQQAPMQFDSKGKPVKPTAEELKALKGDSNLPGYAAEVSNLKQGQVVKVILGKRRLSKGESTGQAGAEKKVHWTAAGDITGRVVGLPSDRPASKGNGKANRERARDAEPNLSIAVDDVLLTRFKVARNQGKIEMGPGVFARRVIILQDAAGEKDPTGK
jgi:hypothetical protein